MFNLKRLAKLFQIGLAAKKVRASQNATEKLLAQRALVNLLADARGLSMKVGQLFASVDGSSPFQPLTHSIPALPLHVMRPILEKSLGQPSKNIFKKIHPAKAAASLGQVHLAELRDGTPVAIKIRYPDIVKAVETELQLAGLVPNLGKAQEWGFDLNAYKQTLRETLENELDYRSEAKRQMYFREHVKVPYLEVPFVYDAFSSESVLVQSQATGVTFPSIIDWSEKERRLIAQTLLQTLFTSVFVAGEIHADPHTGNSFYNHCENGSMVTLLDFGCTIHLTQLRRLALLKLILACRERSAVNAIDCFAALGFEAQKLAHIQGALPMLCHELFRPFLIDYAFNINDWQLEKKIMSLLGEKRWWFRAAGAADILLLIRAFQGVILQLQQLHTHLSWWECLKNSTSETLRQQARDMILPTPNIIVSAYKALDFASQAQKLHVKITENNKPLVALSLPAEAALDLEILIPEEVRRELDKLKIVDLKSIQEKLKLEGLLPQELFSCHLNIKHYQVWLQ